MKNILVVDDNTASLRQIAAQLGTHYDIRPVKSGALALQACIQEKPDLILLDIEMPGMDGFETLARLRRNPWLESVPVIFLSGNNDAATEVRGLEAGARDFIAKPVEKNILLHRVELHLGFATYQKQLAKRVRETADSIATSFAELIEWRDVDTGEHVVRTSRYVDLLGQELMRKGLFQEELTEDTLRLYVRAAPLHDIGKIAISDSILLKPDRLCDEEFSVMKRHASIGADILGHMYARTPALLYLRYAEMIAGSHHERYDGKGYPNCLAGDDIPLCGRIMVVADTYDALVSDRVYRKGIDKGEARAVITAGKGTQFDPRLVEAFEAICHDL